MKGVRPRFPFTFPGAFSDFLDHALCPQRLTCVFLFPTPPPPLARKEPWHLEQERYPAELPQAGHSPNHGRTLGLTSSQLPPYPQLFTRFQDLPLPFLSLQAQRCCLQCCQILYLLFVVPPGAHPLLHKWFFCLTILKLPSGSTPSVSSREEAIETLPQGIFFPVTKIYIISVKHFPYGQQ